MLRPNLSNLLFNPDEVRFKSVMGHHLKKEQHQFFIHITESCTGPNDTARRNALKVLREDASICRILPELCRFIADAVNLNVVLKNLTLLSYLMQMVAILHCNANLRIQPFLHLLIPAVVTCQVANKLSTAKDKYHWQLREYACEIMGQLINKFANSTNRMVPRLMNVYKSGLEKSSLTTIYGSLIGLQALGDTAIYGCVIPKIRDISKLIEPHLPQDVIRKKRTSRKRRKEAAKYIQIRIVNMCSPLLNRIHNPTLTLEEHCEKYGFLGHALNDAVAWQRICDKAIKTDTDLSINWKIIEMMRCLKLNEFKA
ncbi:transcription initiation factor TFIID subunit 6 [Drosophila grimshawi]|nr:transcription initiation factor TFIID subunit 6 [Drosophila grimshawi]